jgi:hypothetical protein
MEATSATVDQERFFKNKPGGRFLAAVMIGLGEFARGLREDSTNGALDIINASIDKDIQEQKDEIASKKDAVSLKMNAYARELADGADPRLAEEKLRFAQEKVAQTDLLRSSAMARNAEAKAAFDAASAKLGQQSLDRRIAIEGMEKVKVDQDYQTARAGGFVAPTLKQVAEESGYEKTLVSNKVDLAGLSGQLNPTAQGEGAKAAAVAEAKAKGEIAGANGASQKEIEHTRELLNLADANWRQYEQIAKQAGGRLLPDGTVEGASFPWDLPGGDTSETGDLKAQLIQAGLGSASIANDGRELGEPAKEKLIASMNTLENTSAKIQGNAKAIAAKRKEWLAKLAGSAPGSSGAPGITETDATR